MSKYFIGIDIGTQGARVVLLNETGVQIGAREEVFELTQNSREEQSPLVWWDSCHRLIGVLISDVQGQIDLSEIKSIAVTSTSGTIIPLDKEYNPLHPAIMYSDPRSAAEAAVCKETAQLEIKHGYSAFNASSGLPKMRWFVNQYPLLVNDLYKFIHAADFITGRLCGEYGITDYTNALKSGYDIHDFNWPAYITEKIGIEREWLQEVWPSGTPLGNLQASLAIEWGLPSDIVVTTGMTDGCASQVAAGAVSPGQWNTTLGTTMVIKGVTNEEIVDPSGAIYNHRHPSGYWMPGGASNTGADWVGILFYGRDLNELAKMASSRLPSAEIAWPLLQKGERFPFFAPDAVGIFPEADDLEKFIACMEGVAFIERYAYDRIVSLSGEKIDHILSAGGGSKNETWLKIRSAVLNLPVSKMTNVSGAAGAAILAASRTFYSSLEDAASAMAKPELVVEPDPALVKAYETKYQLFLETLKSKNILA